MLTTRRRSTKTHHGFTIVELLIVIVVIAILATITIVSYNGIRNRANVSKANADLLQLEKAIMVARLQTGETLMQITGSNCSYCYGQATTNTSIDRIAQASNTVLDGIKAGDPWGNMYHIDENEGESSTNPCVHDVLNVTPSQTGVSQISIPFYSAQCGG